jgi:osmotically-inducible protein OsmY
LLLDIRRALSADRRNAMRRQLFWLAALGLGLAVACSDTRASESEERMESPVAAGTDADDTGRNTRDRDGLSKTPLDQSNTERDLEITQQIRQRISDADDLSIDAENVKVTTENAVVTLRGPVETAREKEAIAAIARETAGVTRVDDQLEVATR